jgi:hypothetical protein
VRLDGVEFVLEKPTKIARRYESWRGTPAHLVELGQSVAREIQRAAKAAKAKADEEVEKFVTDWLAQYEQSLRARGAPPAERHVTLPSAARVEPGDHQRSDL